MLSELPLRCASRSARGHLRNAMKICRFSTTGENAHVGMALNDTHILDLTPAGIGSLSSVLESPDPLAVLSGIDRMSLPQLPISDMKFRAPVERQEVWAAGVTY